MSRIVQLANFVTPSSGGLRTALDQLSIGYAAAGHEVVQVVPGGSTARRTTSWGQQWTLAAPEVPGTGYRLLVDRRPVRRVLEHLQPDRVEVHDRTTLRWVGRWASDARVPSLVVSHERLDRWLQHWLPRRLPLSRTAARSNATLAAAFDGVVCTTAWAEAEFTGVASTPVWRIPLGVDLDRFTTAPRRSDDGAGLQVAMASRLSPEKRPDLAIGAARELLRRGHRLHLVIAGDGPLRAAVAEQTRNMPVDLLGFVRDRDRLASVLRDADVVLAPGPVETFGLAALEAMACGTPVVANVHSALPEVLGDAGEASASTPRSFADAVERLLARPPEERRVAARRRAEQFPWTTTVEGFLRAHRLPLGRASDAVRR